MGKRIKLIAIYRPSPRSQAKCQRISTPTQLALAQASSGTKKKRVPRGKLNSPITGTPIIADTIQAGTSEPSKIDRNPVSILAHKRALKAASQRKWRAKVKAAK